MQYTKIFKSGNSWAVRLPKGFKLEGDEVEIMMRGNEIIIREKPRNLKRAFDLLTQLPKECFSSGRRDTPPQKREEI